MNWLFLRGLVREQRHWGRFPEIFKAARPQDRVHFLDLPGVGTELGRPVPLTIAKTREDLRNGFQGLKARVPGPWSLFTISLGSMIALDWVHEYPTDFERLVVMNTSSSDLSTPLERLRPRVFALAFKLLQIPRTDHLRRELAILEAVSNKGSDFRNELAQEWAEVSRSAPIGPMVIARQLMAARKFISPDKIPVPLLVLASEGDHFVSSECSKRLAKKYNANLLVHPKAGHDLSLDEPEWVVNSIGSWLANS